MDVAHRFVLKLSRFAVGASQLLVSFAHVQTVPDSNFAKAALTSMAALSRAFLDVVKCGEIKVMKSGCAEGVGTC